MMHRGSRRALKAMVEPATALFSFFQKNSRVQVWLYEQCNLRIEGRIVGFDEYMNLVLVEACERHMKSGAKRFIVPSVGSEDAGLQGRILICRSFVRQLLCLAKKLRVRLSPVMRRSICPSCFVILEPSVTCRLRFRKRRLITRCEACGAVSHLPVPSGVWQPCYFEEVLVDSSRHAAELCNTVLRINDGGRSSSPSTPSRLLAHFYAFFCCRLEAFQKLGGILLPGLRVSAMRWNSSTCNFDPKHLKVLACPLSKKPLNHFEHDPSSFAYIQYKGLSFLMFKFG
ncbi:hypothetical protein SprV_0602043800 [Sparganum proliferum]